MSPAPESDETSLVLRGTFHPAIFHPFWFLYNYLIKGYEATQAQLTVTKPELSDFSIGWAHLRVTQERFAVTIQDAYYFKPMCDLIHGTFALFVEKPVVAAAELQRKMTFQFPARKHEQVLNRMMADQSIWSGVMTTPRLTSVAVEEQRSDPPGRMRVRIDAPTDCASGIRFELSFDYELKASPLKQCFGALPAHWQADFTQALRVAETLITLT